MASRPELVSMCIELGIPWHGLSREELKSLIREEADRRWKNRKVPNRADNLSEELKKFLTREYDFTIITQKEGFLYRAGDLRLKSKQGRGRPKKRKEE